MNDLDAQTRAGLTPSQQRLLLNVARWSIIKELGPTEPPRPEPEIRGHWDGAFVTLMVGGQLRGCMGSFAPTDDIVTTIRATARSALHDPRFSARLLTAAELPRLDIELSLLSDLSVTRHPLELKIGHHGIIVRRGSRSGCFLPKVAVQRSWDAEAFLSNCCTMKAGLPADAWRQPDAEVELFTAQVFSDSSTDDSYRGP